MADDLVVRAFRPETDEAAVLELFEASLGWERDDVHRSFFRWKHTENPFGRSAAWVAESDGRLAGFRTFLRWAWDVPGRGTVPAVRAVDTATHPDFQGRGVFSRLTLHALDELAHEGVGFVFNTPNDKSRPGYLKMGWRLVARLPVWARPRSLLAAPKLLGAAVPADLWSLDRPGGRPALEVLSDEAGVVRLLGSLPARAGAATLRSPAFLRWRYGFPALRYRAMCVGASVEDGVALYRLRRRGRAVEATICDVLVPGDDDRVARRLLRAVARRSGADYAVRLAGQGPRAAWFTVPGQGPTFVWRHVTGDAPPPRWDLALGDIELF
jgi:GNAT superfamily N-acetyltransferase